MNNIFVVNVSWINDYGLFENVFFKVEGIVWCIVFILIFVLIVVGNLFMIIIFMKSKSNCKKYVFLFVNMVFVDLMLGVVVLFLYIYYVGFIFYLWIIMESFMSKKFFDIFFMIVDIVFV